MVFDLSAVTGAFSMSFSLEGSDLEKDWTETQNLAGQEKARSALEGKGCYFQ